MDQNQPISPCNGDAISASVRIMARSLQHRRVAWMHDFRDSPTRRSSHSTNPEVERRRPRRDTAPPNFRVFKVNQPVVGFFFIFFIKICTKLNYKLNIIFNLNIIFFYFLYIYYRRSTGKKKNNGKRITIRVNVLISEKKQ